MRKGKKKYIVTITRYYGNDGYEGEEVLGEQETFAVSQIAAERNVRFNFMGKSYKNEVFGSDYNWERYGFSAKEVTYG